MTEPKASLEELGKEYEQAIVRLMSHDFRNWERTAVNSRTIAYVEALKERVRELEYKIELCLKENAPEKIEDFYDIEE